MNIEFNKLIIIYIHLKIIKNHSFYFLKFVSINKQTYYYSYNFL